MTIDTNKLESALKSIKGNSKFYDLLGAIIRLSVMGKVSKNINDNLSYLYDDLLNIYTIIYRLNWQKDLFDKKEIDLPLWMQFAKCDISLFYIELRSIFDYIAKIIHEIPSKDKTPWSFEDLRKGVLSKKYPRLDRDIIDLVKNCNWFDQLKDIRDVNIHFGGQILALKADDIIAFQIYNKKNEQCFIKEIMYNKNAVNFELYSAMYIGYLIDFIEQFAIIILRILKIEEDGATTSHGEFYGLTIVEEWIRKLLANNPRNKTN